MNGLEETVKQLKGTPLYYFFIASREEFSSNFWLWLSSLNQYETLELLCPHDSIDHDLQKNAENGDLTFVREQKISKKSSKSNISLDLGIYAGEEPKVVIEHKLKDFPENEQLEKIKQQFEGQNEPEPVFVLISLLHPGDEFDGWNLITYQDLSQRINPNNFTQTQDTYYQSLIEEYKAFTSNLGELSEQHLRPTGEYDFAESHNKGKTFKRLLEEVQMWVTYQKIRSSHLIQKFQDNYNDHDALTGCRINNRKATMNFFLQLRGSEEFYDIGIEVEDNQFRRFIRRSNDKNQDHSNYSAEKLAENNIFFDSNWKNQNKDSFNRYKPTFFYQYEKINQRSLQKLYEKINNELKYLANNREEITKYLL